MNGTIGGWADVQAKHPNAMAILRDSVELTRFQALRAKLICVDGVLVEGRLEREMEPVTGDSCAVLNIGGVEIAIMEHLQGRPGTGGVLDNLADVLARIGYGKPAS